MFGREGLEQRLQEQGGVVAWATVVSARQRWRQEHGAGIGSGPSQITDHMKLTLKVEPEGEPAFEATLRQAFVNDIPQVGGRVKVIYDPADRSKIAVLRGEVYLPGLSVDQQQRSTERVAEARAAFASGNLAEYIEQMQAEALGSGVTGAPVTASGRGAASLDVIEQLTRLADLRDRGALTEAEFQAQKAKLLAAG